MSPPGSNDSNDIFKYAHIDALMSVTIGILASLILASLILAFYMVFFKR